MYCACGHACDARDRFCGRCGRPAPQPQAAPRPVATSAPVSDDVLLARLADYERASAILWLVLGIVQVLFVVTIIAGVWNIYAATTRFKLSPLIRARDACIPKSYEDGLVQLIVLGAINFLLGAAIGVVFVVFDFFIRDQVLKHRHLFDSPAPAADAAGAPSAATSGTVQ